ncbi:DivIVA domain-containing protein [bacterium]|nr:DivIVA domain-containing protein [bacterium]
MKLLPIDIRQKEFSSVFRGFEKSEVISFLTDISDSVEGIIEENNRHKEEVLRLKEQLKSYQDIENIMKKTMITAQQIKDDIQLSSKKEYDLIVAEAKLEASRILSEARERSIQYQKEIDELIRQKKLFKMELFNIIQSHMRLLEFKDDI